MSKGKLAKTISALVLIVSPRQKQCFQQYQTPLSDQFQQYQKRLKFLKK
jgi:hypothetical protein